MYTLSWFISVFFTLINSTELFVLSISVLEKPITTDSRNNEYKVYIYEHILENEHSLYGFSTSKEKELFLKLIVI